MLLFRLLPRALSSEVFAQLQGDDQNRIIASLTDEEARKLLASLRPDERTELFDELPAEVTRRLLSLLSPEDLRETRWLLGYPSQSVGRLMTPDYLALQQNWTVQRALGHVRKEAARSEMIDVLYVRSATWELVGVLTLRMLLIAKPRQNIEDIMQSNVVSLNASDDQESAVHVMQEHALAALPVVDSHNVLIGIVTFDDIMDVAEEETTEDFYRTSGMAPLSTSYAHADLWNLYSRRVGWLAALVLVNLASSGVIAAYEVTLSSAITLAFFIPLLIDSGGNTGSQSAMLMIRALATGDVTASNWLRTLSKEVIVSVMLGLTLALLSAVLGVFRGGPIVGLIIALSMVCIIIISNLIGSILPFLLTRMRLDPAVASGPLVTSIVDATSLFIYLSIATALLT